MKLRSSFVCQSCGYSQVGWSGRCPNCGEWNTLVETVVESPTTSKGKERKSNVKPVLLSSVVQKKSVRISTKISELDRVLGGGMVPGQVILIAGEPGIGKSTLLLQLTNNVDRALYVSGEESAAQIKIRAARLGVTKKSVQILETTDIDNIVETVGNEDSKSVVIVDSIQTVSTADLSGMAGSVGQVRECTYRLVRTAKRKNIPLYIVGHVTKEGSVAGPALLTHLVDTVLWFEGEKSSTLRMLRANKNRFGSTDEVGIFRMDDVGLQSVPNASEVFITDGKKSVPGSVITSVVEGARPILAEIQSLVVPSKLVIPRRVVQGIDPRRAEIILAILSRRSGVPVNLNDVFINVVGGLTLKEPAIDLAIAMSLASAYFDKPLPKNTLAIGEVDLLGEIRPTRNSGGRIKEARRLGYKNIISSQNFKYLSQAIRKYLK